MELLERTRWIPRKPALLPPTSQDHLPPQAGRYRRLSSRPTASRPSALRSEDDSAVLGDLARGESSFLVELSPESIPTLLTARGFGGPQDSIHAGKGWWQRSQDYSHAAQDVAQAKATMHPQRGQGRSQAGSTACECASSSEDAAERGCPQRLRTNGAFGTATTKNRHLSSLDDLPRRDQSYARSSTDPTSLSETERPPPIAESNGSPSSSADNQPSNHSAAA